LYSIFSQNTETTLVMNTGLIKVNMPNMCVNYQSHFLIS